MRPFALVLLASLLLPTVLGALPRTETQAYTTGEGEVALPAASWPPPHAFPPLTFPPSPFPSCPPQTGGGACFTLDGSEHQVIVALHDAVAARVGADAQVFAANGTLLASQAFCATGTMTMPPGAASLEVLLYDAAIGTLVCGPGTIEPTTGTITATFG